MKNNAKTIMIQGTASSVGKSVIVTALCRIFKQDGYKVAPFKAQNMALNSFVTPEGGEIGRAQAVQAEAAGIPPTVDMNPVLLKPTSNSGCQVVVRGKVAKTISAQEYNEYAPTLLKTVMESLERLRNQYDIVVIEGAGSPAETNLKEQEIVNMRIAKESSTPVLLAGDIDKGGVFASLFGTIALMDEDEQRYFKGMIINKFRGDVSLLKPAIDDIEKRTKLPVLGVLPYFKDIRIAQEDSVFLDERKNTNRPSELNITVIRLPHIANFDELEPLELEGIDISYISQRFEMLDPHLIIIPGTKNTTADMQYLWGSGLGNAIIEKAKTGTPVFGICGGYQILGKKIIDRHRVESDKTEVEGLGLIDAVTEFLPEKATKQVTARCVTDAGLLAGIKGQDVSGFEIHMGQTKVNGDSAAFRVTSTSLGPADYPDGAINAKGNVVGTYIHGILYNDEFRHALLNNVRRYWGLTENDSSTASAKDPEYNKLADLVRKNLDMKRIYDIMESPL